MITQILIVSQKRFFHLLKVPFIGGNNYVKIIFFTPCHNYYSMEQTKIIKQDKSEDLTKDITTTQTDSGYVTTIILYWLRRLKHQV